MRGRPFLIAFFLGLMLVSSLRAQVVVDDLPKILPANALSAKDRAHRESLHLFVFGLLCEREDRLFEALKAFEQASKLDPEAPALYLAQVPILLALDRTSDAQTALGKALRLDPTDHEAWFLSARVHKSVGQYQEARAALGKGLKCAGMKDHPELAQQMYRDLGALQEVAEELPLAIASYTAAAAILDHPDPILETGAASREAIMSRAADTYEKIGHLHRKLKQPDAAIAAFKKAQARYPDGGGRLNYNLAQLAQEQGKLADALVFLDAYLRLQPLGLEAYDMKMRLLERLERKEQVIPWLEQAVKADAHNVGLKLLLANQYRQARRFAESERLFKAVAADAPSSELYQGLFRLYRDEPNQGMRPVLELVNKGLEEANKKPFPPPGAGSNAKAMLTALRDDAELARALVPVAFAVARQREDLRFETLHFLAVLADKHKRPAEAEAFYRQCLQNPDTSTEAIVYGGYLRVLWKGKKYQEVLKLCDQGLRSARATNHVYFHMERAKALSRLGRTDEALRSADTALDRAGDQERLTVQHLRVRLLAHADKVAEAEAECLAMLKENTNPGNILEIRYLLFTVYSSGKQNAKSEEQLALILKTDPDNATANNDLGYLWADQSKNLKEAEAMIRKALEVDQRQRKSNPRVTAEDDRDNAAYVDSLGWVLFRLGRIEEAKKELERAAALPDGEDPVIFDHLGDVYYRLDQQEQARTSWQKAARLYEEENLRRRDDRYREVLRKLKVIEAEIKGP